MTQDEEDHQVRIFRGESHFVAECLDLPSSLKEKRWMNWRRP
jgi:hypothetical protein